MHVCVLFLAHTHKLGTYKVTNTHMHKIPVTDIGSTVRHTQKVGPPASAGGRLGDLVFAGRQLQMTVPAPLPGGNAKQDSIRRKGGLLGASRGLQWKGQ